MNTLISRHQTTQLCYHYKISSYGSVLCQQKGKSDRSVTVSTNENDARVLNEVLNKYPQLMSNTRSGRGMRCDEAPLL